MLLVMKKTKRTCLFAYEHVYKVYSLRKVHKLARAYRI
jgi:hypothetical protein